MLGDLTSFWQRIYFNIFRLFKFIAYIVSLPILLFLRNKHVKKSYRKRGVADPEGLVLSVLEGPSNFRTMRITDTIMFVLGVLVVCTIANLLSAVIGFEIMANLKNVFVFMSFFLIPSTIINYLLLWRKGKYLDYFKKFDKELALDKRKWGWITFGVVIGIILMLILSYKIVSK